MKPSKPYYAVIFTSTLNKNIEGYDKMADKMEHLAKQQRGFIGLDTARNFVGITVSYWKSLDAINIWKQHTAHLLAQELGKKDWYKWYSVKICKVERDYEFKPESKPSD